MGESMAKRYKRYVKYMFQWIFTEKIRGLDFTMRDKSLITQSGGVLHGYSKTDEAHAKAIFERIAVNPTMKLLDIGCGKGVFLREASKYPFGKIAGIEYVEEIAATAKRNFRKLGLLDRISIYHGDATKFKKYNDYNVLYFANPFNAEIMDMVLERVFTDRKDDVWIIYHNPTCATVVEAHGCIEIDRLYDEVKSYETRIYRWQRDD